MALTRRSGSRFEANIWPGFVDAMTAILLVLMFVLSIFMIVQFVLREQVNVRDRQLDDLGGQVAQLANALGLEQQRVGALESTVDGLNTDLADAEAQAAQQAALIATLSDQRETANARIASFEEQVAGLLSRNADLDTIVSGLREDLTARNAELDQTNTQLDQSQTALLATQAELEARTDALTDARAAGDAQAEQNAALELALAQARTEIDASTQAARLDAARAQALERLATDLRARVADQAAEIADRDAELNAADQNRLADAAAAAALRARLANADAELTAMTLRLETERQRAEDTLTLLAAARLARDRMEGQNAEAQALLAAVQSARAALEAEAGQAMAARDDLASENAALRAELETTRTALADARSGVQDASDQSAETLALLEAARAARATLEARVAAAQVEADAAVQAAAAAAQAAADREALLASARDELSDAQTISLERLRQVEVLSQQTAALNQQLSELQSILDEAKAQEVADQVRIDTLGSDLNIALARVAAEERKVAREQTARADLEAAERARLEAEANNLENYRSEFFGRVREILGDREGIEIVGDRFVFSSEVLFARGSAFLGPEGEAQLAQVASVIREIQGEIPEGINWILRVDGHTDNIPISGGSFVDNWELSQARALSVVRYLIDAENLPANRLAANGFGEFQPIDTADTDEARARNRRIELKFTEK